MKLHRLKNMRSKKFSSDQVERIAEEGEEDLLASDFGTVADTVLESESEDDLLLSDEDLKGRGLTAEEIARSPEIGAWADDPEIPSGAEYVEKIRRSRG